METRNVLLLGGSGFIGSAVAARLCDRNSRVVVPTRIARRARALSILPTVSLVQADIHDTAQLLPLMRGMDAVINLVGILHGNFEREHVQLPRLVAECCVKADVPRLVHMSALNADVTAPSAYLQSRDRGEAAVAAVAAAHPALHTTVFQPSVVFGEGDKFLNMFAGLVKFSPVIPLGSPGALFQPVWVEDLARAIVQCLDMPQTFGQTYPMVGPRIYTLKELLQFVMAATGHQRPIIGLGSALTGLQAAVFERLPGKLITRDNVRSMQVPSTCEQGFPAIFGTAHAMETIAGAYLGRADTNGGRARYTTLRAGAGRTGQSTR